MYHVAKYQLQTLHTLWYYYYHYWKKSFKNAFKGATDSLTNSRRFTDCPSMLKAKLWNFQSSGSSVVWELLQALCRHPVHQINGILHHSGHRSTRPACIPYTQRYSLLHALGEGPTCMSIYPICPGVSYFIILIICVPMDTIFHYILCMKFYMPRFTCRRAWSCACRGWASTWTAGQLLPGSASASQLSSPWSHSWAPSTGCIIYLPSLPLPSCPVTCDCLVCSMVHHCLSQLYNRYSPKRDHLSGEKKEIKSNSSYVVWPTTCILCTGLCQRSRTWRP